jgi:hypothetical protein
MMFSFFIFKSRRKKRNLYFYSDNNSQLKNTYLFCLQCSFAWIYWYFRLQITELIYWTSMQSGSSPWRGTNFIAFRSLYRRDNQWLKNNNTGNRHRKLLRYENESLELIFRTKKKLTVFSKITSVLKCLSASWTAFEAVHCTMYNQLNGP